jgi:hypothetical protein
MNCNEFSTFISVLSIVFIITIVIRQQESFENKESEPIVVKEKQIIGMIHPARAGPLHYNYAKPEFIPPCKSYDIIYDDGTFEHV